MIRIDWIIMKECWSRVEMAEALIKPGYAMRFLLQFENKEPTPRNIATQIKPLIRKNRNPMIPILLIQIMNLFIIGLLPGMF